MIEIATDAGLPRPGPDRLVLYVLGPGFGESQIVAFPDGRWMVVDGCVRAGLNRAGLNLPLSLLEHLGCRAVDLLVVTHPDLDHIRGVPQLIERFPPERVWMYPAARSLRNLIVRWTERAPAGRRHKLAALRDLHVNMGPRVRSTLPRGISTARGATVVRSPCSRLSTRGGASCPTRRASPSCAPV